MEGRPSTSTETLRPREEVAGKGADDFVVPVLGAGGEAFLATEGVVT